MGEETDNNAAAYSASGGGEEESQLKTPPASPETVPPGFEPHRSLPPPPPPGFESHLSPVPLPVSEMSQLELVGSSCQAFSLLNATQTTGEETEGNVNKDDGSVIVSQESPSKTMARLLETAPLSRKSLCPPSLLSPPLPTPLPASEESQLIPKASSSQALSLLNVAQTMGEETEGNENKDGGSVTVSKESPSKPMASLPGTSPPDLESLRPPSPLPSPLVPTLFPDEKILGRDGESFPSNHQTVQQSKEASSSEPTISLGQMVCGTCRALLSYPRGARHVQCPCCHSLNFVLEECGKCEVLLMYQHGAPAVRCSHCNHVTAIGEHNSRTLDSVLQGYPLQPQIPVYESTQLNGVAVQNP